MQCAARNGPAGRVFAIDERTGFDPFPTDAERFFSFWSVQSRAEDGKVTEVQAGRVAELRGCFALHYCRNVHPGQKWIRRQGDADVPRSLLTVNRMQRFTTQARCLRQASSQPALILRRHLQCLGALA